MNLRKQGESIFRECITGALRGIQFVKKFVLDEYLHFPGFSPMSTFVKNGVRQSSANSFLQPAMERSNLQVVTEAHVTRVTIRIYCLVTFCKLS